MNRDGLLALLRAAAAAAAADIRVSLRNQGQRLPTRALSEVNAALAGDKRLDSQAGNPWDQE